MKHHTEYKVFADEDLKKLDIFHYEDDSGLPHGNLESLLSNYIGSCGCGSPEDNLIFTKNFLDLREKQRKEREGIPYFTQDSAELYKTHDNEIKEFLSENHEEVEQFILYVLDNKGILEHGSSVNSSWINEENKFKENLDYWYNNERTEE